jgi:hypothetical protein
VGRRVDFGDVFPETETIVPAELQAPLRETIKREAARRVELAAREAEGRGRPVEVVADEAGIDLARECPVCRSLDPCECEEPDRAFVRRARFLPGVAGVPRCPRCRAPMSTFYVPRRGTSREELPELKRHTALTACVPCRGDAVAAVLDAIADRYREET